MANRKPNGYWTDFENVREVMQDLERELGHFPSQREIYDAGYTSVPAAINNHHGGLNKVAEKLGRVTQQRKTGHWTLKRVKQACRDFIDEHGHFPTQRELTNRNDRYRGLNSGMNRHGGLERIRRLIGAGSDRAPKNYWSRERILTQTREIVREHGSLPNQRELREMGHGALAGAIGKYTSLTEVRRDLGLDVTKAGKGFWTEERIIEECRRVVDEHGDLPTKDEFKELGLGALAGQIEKRGGYPYFRGKLGLDTIYKRKGFWNRDNTYAEADRLYTEYGDLPPESKLRELGMGTLPQAAREHFGGMQNLRETLREAHGDLDDTEENMKDLAYVQDQLRQIRDENDLKRIPGQETLIQLGRGDLVQAIRRYHGGMNAVRGSLGAKVVSPNGTWDDPDHVINEARRLMAEHCWEDWPSEKVLRQNGYNMLPVAVRRTFGNVAKFREALGVKQGRVQRGAWKDLDYTISEAARAMGEIGCDGLPTQKVLAEHGYNSLSQAISKYHGGYAAFRGVLYGRMGIEVDGGNELETLLNTYTGGSESG